MVFDTELILDALRKHIEAVDAKWDRLFAAQDARWDRRVSTCGGAMSAQSALPSPSSATTTSPAVADAAATPAAPPEGTDARLEVPLATRVPATATAAAEIVNSAEPLPAEPATASSAATFNNKLVVPATSSSSSAPTPTPEARDADEDDITNTTPTRCSTRVPTPTLAPVNLAVALVPSSTPPSSMMPAAHATKEERYITSMVASLSNVLPEKLHTQLLGKGPWPPPQLCLKNPVMLDLMHLTLVHKRSQLSILNFEQVCIPPKPPWSLHCLEYDSAKSNIATRVTLMPWTHLLVLTEYVKLRPIPWPSFREFDTATAWQNTMSLLVVNPVADTQLFWCCQMIIQFKPPWVSFCSESGVVGLMLIQYQQQQPVSAVKCVHGHFKDAVYCQSIVQGNPNAMQFWEYSVNMHWLNLLLMVYVDSAKEVHVVRFCQMDVQFKAPWPPPVLCEMQVEGVQLWPIPWMCFSDHKMNNLGEHFTIFSDTSRYTKPELLLKTNMVLELSLEHIFAFSSEWNWCTDSSTHGKQGWICHAENFLLPLCQFFEWVVKLHAHWKFFGPPDCCDYEVGNITRQLNIGQATQVPLQFLAHVVDCALLQHPEGSQFLECPYFDWCLIQSNDVGLWPVIIEMFQLLTWFKCIAYYTPAHISFASNISGYMSDAASEW
ncbi:unnamed protein product [Urochloa humidicola]